MFLIFSQSFVAVVVVIIGIRYTDKILPKKKEREKEVILPVKRKSKNMVYQSVTFISK